MHHSAYQRQRHFLRFPLLLALAGALLFAGCSSSAETDGNSAGTAPERTSLDSNSANGSAPLETSTAPELPAGMTEQQKKRLEDAFAANVQLPEETVHPGLKAKPATRPAPDNSEYFSTLTDVATETRLFKGHPVLNKVERITSGNQVKLRIHLKNGRVVDADGKNVTNMPIASAATFMQIGGLPALPTPTPAASSTSTKKKQDDAASDVDPAPAIRQN